MSAKPRIFVFRMREMIYTLLLIAFAAILIVCLILMFSGRAITEKNTTGSTQSTSVQQPEDVQTFSASSAASASQFTPGIYTVPISLNDSALEVEVTVDADHINSIRLVNLIETTDSMYPLLSPSLDHIATQVLQKQSLEEITSPQENRYTSQMLLKAVSDALELAKS